ncbi:PaaI family thioesterase [Anaerobiospirillum sp. NML120449]|uniref:PaaI family thioesterase n=1 Tax=Anaerobiospirillum sp. NML120449 TaxID=2932817 RepID=UPI001FF57939|nr:PaaI family thioesterase [Anaerobiospirillum sp. NML120449]MCK0527353.1 PaaI family thioesterase [Anaerobiospirillum sp. NML120449]
MSQEYCQDGGCTCGYFSSEPAYTPPGVDGPGPGDADWGCVFGAGLENFDLESALHGRGPDSEHDCLVRALAPVFTLIERGQVHAEVTLAYVHCRPTPAGHILHGGTSLALAETVAGVASMALCEPGEHPVGMNVTASHVSMARLGQKLKIICTSLHKGSTSHLWNIDITDENGKMISTARVTNAIIKKL